MNPNTHFQKPDSVQNKEPLRGELSSGLPLFLLPCGSRSLQQRMQEQAGQHKGSALPWLITRPVSHKCMSQQLVGRLGSLQSSTFLSAHSGPICWMCGVGVQSLQCVQHDWLPRNATLVWKRKKKQYGRCVQSHHTLLHEEGNEMTHRRGGPDFRKYYMHSWGEQPSYNL